MAKRIQILIFCISVAAVPSSHAQFGRAVDFCTGLSEPEPVLLTTERWKEGAWKEDGRQVFTFLDDRLAESTGYSVLSDSRVDSNRVVYAYDGSGRLATQTYLHSEQRRWTNRYRVVYEYTPGVRIFHPPIGPDCADLSALSREYWEDGMWRAAVTETATFSDGKQEYMVIQRAVEDSLENRERIVIDSTHDDRRVVWRRQRWDSLQTSWMDDRRWTERRLASDTLELTVQRWNDGWTPEVRSIRILDEAARELESIYWRWNDGWVPNTRQVRRYNTSGCSKTITNFNYVAGAWSERSKHCERSEMAADSSMHVFTMISTAGQDTTRGFRQTTYYVDPGAVTSSEAEPAEPGHNPSVYPNPSRGNAEVVLRISESEHARVAIYDALGREVAVLADRLLLRGTHQFSWAASGVSSGLYFVRIESGTAASTSALTIVR